MEKHWQVLSEQISAEEWANTPTQVQELIISLLDSRDMGRSPQIESLEQEVIERVSALAPATNINPQTLIRRSQPDTTITFANTALSQLWGEPVENIVGQTWRQFVISEENTTPFTEIADLSPEELICRTVYPEIRANDQVGWTEWLHVGIFDDQNQLIELQSLGRDVTLFQEKIQQEEALKQLIQDIHSSLDLDTVFTRATTGAAQLLKNLDVLLVQYFPEEGLWRHVAEFHQDPNAASVLELVIPDAENPFAAQLKKLQPLWVDKTNPIADEINQQIAESIPGAWLLTPIAIDGKLWGSLTAIAHQEQWVWQAAQMDLIQTVVSQIEVAIQQADLYQQVQYELAERLRIEAALQESETIFQNMASNMPGAIFRYVLHPDGRDTVLFMSQGCLRLWEVEAAVVTDNANILWQMVHPDDVSDMFASVVESAQTLEPWRFAWRITTPSGQTKWLEAAGKPTQQANGDIIWDTLILDVSDRKWAEAAQRDSENRYRLLAENSNDLVCLHDINGRLTYVSPSCEMLLGYQYSEMLGQSFNVFLHPDDLSNFTQQSQSIIQTKKITPITYRIRQKNGQYIWFETLIKPIENIEEEVTQLQTTSRDVTQRIEFQNQLKYEAFHDTLTGLPNRAFLIERLEFVLHKTKRLKHYKFAILFLDLDRFKVINDSLGHLTGDQLLIDVAQKLQQILRATDLAVRLGGDEFVILLEEVDNLQTPIRVIERIFQELKKPIFVGDRQVYTTASVGVVIGNKKYKNTEDLLRDADTAMYRAKAKGKSNYEIFDRKMHLQVLQQLHLESDLRRAIANQEFLLYYQPVVALDTGILSGFEALIRWQHPTKGLQSPDVFIALAEETGLIKQIDQWALSEACRQLRSWQILYPDCPPLKISVNLSAEDLKQANLLGIIDDVLLKSQLNPACLTLEITESMIIEDIEATTELIHQLTSHSIQISMDDFGTGYSSLSYLHRLPVDNLKVDQSFVRQMMDDHRNHQIVETIFTLSQRLELQAIAEGIETTEQLHELQQLGYQFGQGYLFSRPLSAEAVDDLLLNQRTQFF